jgi:hypothetical protein
MPAAEIPSFLAGKLNDGVGFSGRLEPPAYAWVSYAPTASGRLPAALLTLRPMKIGARMLKSITPLLLVTLAAGCAGEVAEDGASPLPEAIHGLALIESHSGSDAAEILVEMHKAEVVPPQNYIGHYGTEELGAVLYVSRFDTEAGADSFLVAMATRIGPGSGGYGHHSSFDAADKQVHMVFGHGQVHYFYADAEDLVWLAVDARLARPALAELLKTETDSIPTLEEVMMGQPAAETGAG